MIQFMHYDCLARQVSKKKGRGQRKAATAERALFHSSYAGFSIDDVAAEQERATGHCDHVESPQEPELIYGVWPSEAAGIAKRHAEASTDPRGRRIRADAKIAMSGVHSYPVSWQDLQASAWERWKFRLWKRLTLRWTRKRWGGALRSVVLHTDEKYPHFHTWIVDDPTEDGRFGVRNIHPGEASNAQFEKPSSKAAVRAYNESMRAFQDDYYRAVSRRLGHTRSGPGRERLPTNRWKQRIRDAAEMAKGFLQAERMLEEAKAQLAQAERVHRDAKQEHQLAAEMAKKTADWQSQLASRDQTVKERERRVEEREAESERREAVLAEIEAELAAERHRLTRLSAEQERRRTELDERELRNEETAMSQKKTERQLRALTKTLRGLALGELKFAERGGANTLQPTSADPDIRNRWKAITNPVTSDVVAALEAVLRDPGAKPQEKPGPVTSRATGRTASLDRASADRL